ncbi:MAG: hypothetical protein AB8B77_02225 [Alphaproteobacteria bacterium]
MTQILVNDRYVIDDQRPMEQFHQLPALAYAVSRKNEEEVIGYALVCDPKAPPRRRMIAELQKLTNRSISIIYDQAVIDWPSEQRRCPAIIFEIPAGPKLFTTPQSVIKPLSEDHIINHFIQPNALMLQEMHENGQFHRMIRADNIFYEDTSLTEIWLGECVSSPPGLAQPAIYEMLENCLATPAGRSADEHGDLYMLGVTLVALLTGKVPLNDLGDEEVTRLKMAKGSYAALIGSERISMAMMEPLRGLLNDIPEDRWDIETLIDWADGRRQTPKQPHKIMKATRPLRFAGKDYYTSMELAQAFQLYWDQAISMVRTNHPSHWIRRYLDDAELLEDYNIAAGGSYVHENLDYDRALGRIIIAMHTAGPLRYREISVHITAITQFLAFYHKEPSTRELFKSFISSQIAQFQLGLPDMGARHFKEATKLERIKLYLSRTGIGQGIERVVYEFNPEFPCQSPLLERDFVIRTADLLPALDRVCGLENFKPQSLIDRDIAAFLVAKSPRNTLETDLYALDQGKNIIEERVTQVKILAHLQREQNNGTPFYNLSKTVSILLEPCVERFHNRQMRETILGRLKKVGRQGSLQSVIAAIDSKKEIELDESEFRTAQIDYSHTVYRLVLLLQDLINKGKIADRMGAQISSVISSATAVLIIIVAAVIMAF